MFCWFFFERETDKKTHHGVPKRHQVLDLLHGFAQMPRQVLILSALSKTQWLAALTFWDAKTVWPVILGVKRESNRKPLISGVRSSTTRMQLRASREDQRKKRRMVFFLKSTRSG